MLIRAVDVYFPKVETIIVLILWSAGWSQAISPDASSGKRIPPPGLTEFRNPEMVQILGYDDNAMEPFISRDGNFLFFNNSNSAPTTQLFWATRIDDVTFQYQGQLGGEVNSGGPLDAVASMDLNGNFFFTTTRSYQSNLSTIYAGPFKNGAVTPVNPLAGVAAPTLGLVNFDSEISADGNALYFTQGTFSTGALTSTAMLIATRQDGNFMIDSNSANIMKTINGQYLNYAPDTSADELELFFTRTDTNVGPAIYRALRELKSQPFSEPRKIDAITGFAEAPSISPDGLSLYYHVKNANGEFVINRVTRTFIP